jgi:hypothetical protein
MSEPQEPRSMSVTLRGGRASRMPLLVGAGVGLALAIGLGVWLWPAREGRIVFEVEPVEAEVAVLLPEGGRLVLSGPDGAAAVLRVGRHRAEVSAPGFVTRSL